MRLITIFLVSIILSGCSASSQMYNYRAPGNSDMWVIDGHINFLSGDIVINIDSQPVITGSLPSSTLSGVLKGKYLEKEVIADCRHVVRLINHSYEECRIVIDGELATIMEIKQPGT